ncbi:hypothetical protein BD289DRAFT_128099 [Coniella lustricola]|uniref:DUF7702 domain-containing protein n=1 Tax=Coniella lustricola TaxID=2025994 RepID=A0A2T2ZW84_9PEZI|nr:hypothetical protein BD289DRAFT_128099 [Coniella lustricola]
MSIWSDRLWLSCQYISFHLALAVSSAWKRVVVAHQHSQLIHITNSNAIETTPTAPTATDMAETSKGYAAAVLAIYLILMVPAIYTTIKHGFRNHAWIGWCYYIAFCGLRIIGSGMQLANPTSSGAAIISSVGLSPLTISLGGILYEA